MFFFLVTNTLYSQSDTNSMKRSKRDFFKDKYNGMAFYYENNFFRNQIGLGYFILDENVKTRNKRISILTEIKGLWNINTGYFNYAVSTHSDLSIKIGYPQLELGISTNYISKGLYLKPCLMIGVEFISIELGYYFYYYHDSSFEMPQKVGLSISLRPYYLMKGLSQK
jgi:hypothetical protein